MQLTGIITSFNKDWKTGKAIVTLLLDTTNMEHIEKLSKLEKLTVVIKKFFKKRSKDANAYFHVLVNELARYYNISDTEMKIKMNLQYGTIARDTNGNSIGVKIPKGTDITQFYDYAKWFGECTENKIEFDKYLFYKQTHTLNTKEMAQLINGVVQECQERGIETKPKAEIDSLLKEWDKK